MPRPSTEASTPSRRVSTAPVDRLTGTQDQTLEVRGTSTNARRGVCAIDWRGHLDCFPAHSAQHKGALIIGDRHRAAVRIGAKHGVVDRALGQRLTGSIKQATAQLTAPRDHPAMERRAVRADLQARKVEEPFILAVNVDGVPPWRYARKDDVPLQVTARLLQVVGPSEHHIGVRARLSGRLDRDLGRDGDGRLGIEETLAIAGLDFDCLGGVRGATRRDRLELISACPQPAQPEASGCVGARLGRRSPVQQDPRVGDWSSGDPINELPRDLRLPSSTMRTSSGASP